MSISDATAAPLSSALGANQSPTNTAVAASSSPSNLASEETFLKLFVAQLQNQDPLNPNAQDPTQMVSELAQFSQLEQLVNIGQNVQSIDQVVAGSTTPPTSSGTTSGTSGNTTQNSTQISS